MKRLIVGLLGASEQSGGGEARIQWRGNNGRIPVKGAFSVPRCQAVLDTSLCCFPESLPPPGILLHPDSASVSIMEVLRSSSRWENINAISFLR